MRGGRADAEWPSRCADAAVGAERAGDLARGVGGPLEAADDRLHGGASPLPSRYPGDLVERVIESSGRPSPLLRETWPTCTDRSRQRATDMKLCGTEARPVIPDATAESLLLEDREHSVGIQRSSAGSPDDVCDRVHLCGSATVEFPHFRGDL